MDAETLKALKESIEHHKRLKSCRTRIEINNEGYNAESCSLCKKFYKYHGCKGCPVEKSTNLVNCSNTPYHELRIAIVTSGDKDLVKGSYLAPYHDAEIEFLESLLPEEECLHESEENNDSGAAP